MNTKNRPIRYNIIIRILHWLLAMMICGALFMGFAVLQSTPNSDPQKLLSVKMHMLGGTTIGLLMLLRLMVRIAVKNPAPPDTGSALMNFAGRAVHWLLYALVFTLVGSGLATAVAAGLPDIVLGGQGQLPVDFHHIPARWVHGVAAIVAVAVIALHTAAAAYHQFVRRDGLIARMWFGRR